MAGSSASQKLQTLLMSVCYLLPIEMLTENSSGEATVIIRSCAACSFSDEFQMRTGNNCFLSFLLGFMGQTF